MRFPMQMFPMMIMQIIESRVSLTRLQNFFNLPEISPVLSSPGRAGSITVQNGSFKWAKEAETNTLDNIDLEVKPGELVAIVGHIGSGKSSLLSAMLNEMETVEGRVQKSPVLAPVKSPVNIEILPKNRILEKYFDFFWEIFRFFFGKYFDFSPNFFDF